MHLLALALLLAAPMRSSYSTAPADSLPQGTVGLSFGFPLGGATGNLANTGSPAMDVGATYFLSNQNAVRIDFGLNAILSPSANSATAFDLQLGYRMYRGHAERLWAFVQPFVGFGRGPGTAGTNGYGEYFDVGLALGAEYFFTDRFSAGGLVGLSLAVTNIGNSPPAPAPSATGVTLSTGTSGLFVAFYF